MTDWRPASPPPMAGVPVLVWGHFSSEPRFGPEALVGYYDADEGWMVPDIQCGGYVPHDPLYWAPIEPPEQN